MMNKGMSTYHSIQGLYWRESDGTLLAVEGNNSQALSDAWPLLREEICSNHKSWARLRLPSGKQINMLHITADILSLQHIRSKFPKSHRDVNLHTQVSEIEHPNGRVLGVVTSRPIYLVDDAFCRWAEQFILLETEFQPLAQLSQWSSAEHRKTCETVTEIFERRLKNVSRDDQWLAGGRESFMNRVYGFVEKSLPILLCLPAFPCKSPNPNKVGGTTPDLAEHIAMDVLRDFVEEVCQVYKPGAQMWVISDGIVFSDCIGVDDAMVDAYDAKLIQVYKERYPVETRPFPAIAFKGLQDIFAGDSDSFQTFEEPWVASNSMPHPVKTALTSRAELCRKLMLGVAEADRAHIRRCIEVQEPHALQLYRGQTRFMLEDLADVPSVKSLSTKQRKKTAALVAQEMMSRNQAYSNLVELLLPNHVRLSIHAHNNKGPKFAVRLLPKTMVRPIESLENRFEPVSAYEFQLPTPWHNSIIKVEGDELLYLARSQVARNAMAGPDFEGAWVDGPDGSYFSVRRTAPAAVETNVRIPEPASVEQATIVHEREMPTVVITPIQPMKRVDSTFAKSIEKGRWKVFIPLHPMFGLTNVMRNVWRYLTLGDQ
ncbi:hypothetical protein K458DRAFT_360217 [Lentithecium fluviatile CBS 122367]|uniref:Pyoverdine/dityrosine biosynthesis protein n=1 Tax=Lentithecium fluviatile CBS 122367 TaxID=1168545 RepID=A0A6G1JAT1_9PLEO|nr:hypothetical protein K458DRAFT_360217 [Lentithecium fluviatile CBS 122367]